MSPGLDRVFERQLPVASPPPSPPLGCKLSLPVSLNLPVGSSAWTPVSCKLCFTLSCSELEPCQLKVELGSKCASSGFFVSERQAGQKKGCCLKIIISRMADLLIRWCSSWQSKTGGEVELGGGKMLPLLLLIQLVQVAITVGNNLPELNCDTFCQAPCTPKVWRYYARCSSWKTHFDTLKISFKYNP